MDYTLCTDDGLELSHASRSRFLRTLDADLATMRAAGMEDTTAYQIVQQERFTTKLDWDAIQDEMRRRL